MEKAKIHLFLLAVRRLEREHGIYLETSEWFSLSETPPDDRRDGVFQATDTPADTEELIVADLAQGKA